MRGCKKAEEEKANKNPGGEQSKLRARVRASLRASILLKTNVTHRQRYTHTHTHTQIVPSLGFQGPGS